MPRHFSSIYFFFLLLSILFSSLSFFDSLFCLLTSITSFLHHILPLHTVYAYIRLYVCLFSRIFFHIHSCFPFFSFLLPPFITHSVSPSLLHPVWDLGGQTSIRPYWRCYYANTDAIIYVVDSADRDRLAISKSELVSMLEVRKSQKCMSIILLCASLSVLWIVHFTYVRMYVEYVVSQKASIQHFSMTSMAETTIISY